MRTLTKTATVNAPQKFGIWGDYSIFTSYMPLMTTGILMSFLSASSMTALKGGHFKTSPSTWARFSELIHDPVIMSLLSFITVASIAFAFFQEKARKKNKKAVTAYEAKKYELSSFLKENYSLNLGEENLEDLLAFNYTSFNTSPTETVYYLIRYDDNDNAYLNTWKQTSTATITTEAVLLSPTVIPAINKKGNPEEQDTILPVSMFGGN